MLTYYLFVLKQCKLLLFFRSLLNDLQNRANMIQQSIGQGGGGTGGTVELPHQTRQAISISVISWRSVLLVKETVVPRETTDLS
jgi:hypothetical protein